MVNFHFIEDPTTLAIIQGILDVAGPNYNAPYDSDSQPQVSNDKNRDPLLQYQVPGGAELKPSAEPSSLQSIGDAINSVLGILAGFISAYGLILPIIGVIRGIIEVICAMMNPFAVVRAVIRLFSKWIPAFISIFPPLAGVVLIISTIKIILAIVFFILTEVVPTIQLIIANFQNATDAIANENQAAADAVQEKLQAVLVDLINRTGVLGVLIPILEIVFLILGLQSGIPCGGGGTRRQGLGDTSDDLVSEAALNCGSVGEPDRSRGDFARVAANWDQGESDCSCCTDDVCPPILKLPPRGRGLLLPAFYGEVVPGLTYQVFTFNPEVPSLRQFNQSLTDQLNAQLDEEIEEACPPGGVGSGCPTMSIKITSRRGGSREIKANIVAIRGTVVTFINPLGRLFIGSVDYEIEPNYDVLVLRNIIGLACHPDVDLAKEAMQRQFPRESIEQSVTQKFPDTADILDVVNNIQNELNNTFGRLNNEINNGNFNQDAVTEVQNDFVNTFNGFVGDLTNRLNGILAGATSNFNSTLEVDKTIVRADGQEFATIIVTPRDLTGTPIGQNLPNGVSINVSLFTDFGIIQNQRVDNSTGRILADLISATPGTATITAEVNGDLISSVDVQGNESVTELQVRFVSDAILPTRRRVSKQSANTKSSTGITGERSPGGKR